jgi:hypothetical protein
MPWNWSNPSGGQTDTMGEIASRGSPIGPQANFGALVAAILHNKEQEQKQMQAAMSGVEKGVGGYLQGSQNSQLGQYETLTSSPNSADVDRAQEIYNNMSPQLQAQAMQWSQKQQQLSDQQNWTQQQHDLMAQHLGAQTNAQNALADQRRYNTQWSENDQPDGPTGNPALDATHQRLNDQAMLKRQKEQLANMLGVTVQKLPEAIGKINAYRPGDPNATVEATPNQTFPLMQGNDTPGDVKQGAIDAANAYQSMLGNGQQLSQIPGNHPAYAATSLPAGAQSQAVGARGEKIPGVSTANVTSTRKGAGPMDSDIAYLQAHPEAAQKFDARFGQGMAAQYLRQ